MFVYFLNIKYICVFLYILIVLLASDILSPDVCVRLFSFFYFLSLQMEKNRGEKGGFMSLPLSGSTRIESSFNDMSISGGSGGGFGSGSGFGFDTDIEPTKSKGSSLAYSARTIILLPR